MWSDLSIILLCLKVAIGSHYWRDYNGTIPHDAITDKDSGLVIAQIQSLKEECPGTLPAALNASIKVAETECFGRWTQNKLIKVLCSETPNSYKWKLEHPAAGRLNTRNFVDAGYRNERSMYIAKIFHDCSWHYGKVYPYFENSAGGGCYFFSKITGTTFQRGRCFVLQSDFSGNDTYALKKHLDIPKDSSHYWHEFNGTVPSDAFTDTTTGRIIAQVRTVDGNEGSLLAVLNPSTKMTYTECGVREVMSKNDIMNKLYVLCTNNPTRYYWQWVDVYNGNATTLTWVKGGFDIYRDKDLFIGKIFKNGSWFFGKVMLKSGCFFFSEDASSSFQEKGCMILKYISEANSNSLQDYNPQSPEISGDIFNTLFDLTNCTA